jgi:tetratricopeptide (TPR) repeat protein
MGHPAHTSLSERLRSIETEIAAGRAEAALPLCQELATLYPRALAVQRVLGEIYLAMRRPREALAALDRAITGDPEDARACCARAVIHQMHGDQMAALAWYRRACDIRPEDAGLRATYRDMAASLGQPPYQPSRAGLARLYLRGDLFSHAIREWEALVAENNDFTRLEAHAGLVETLWRAGMAREAETWARRTLTNAPSCLKPLLIAGVIEHDEGRDAGAEPFLTRAAGLDPDHRVARVLFADRLSAGDAALAALLWGDMPPFDASSSYATSGSRDLQPAERRVNRPLVTGDAAPPAAPVTRAHLTEPPATPLPPPAPQPSDLPENFRSMFKETEGMLWRASDSDPDTLRTPTVTPLAAPAPPPAPASSAPASSALVSPLAASGIVEFDAVTPPAIAESGFALGDTEMRRAIRWVQWLQAQGARALGEEPQRAQPSGSLDALLNTPVNAPHMTYPAPPGMSVSAAPPVTRLPSIPSQPSGALPAEVPDDFSAPVLPPPSSADLRQMFAELDPEARERDESRYVDSTVVERAPGDALLADPVTPAPGSLEPTYNPLAFEAAPALEPPHPAAPEPEAPKPEAASASYDAPGALADALTWPETPAARDPRLATSAPAVTPDATIEQLARQESAEGFTPFTLEPGALAAIAGEPDVASARANDWLDTGAPTAPEPTAPPAVEPEIAPPAAREPSMSAATDTFAASASSVNPRDYAARLAQARGHRDSGALDEAIIEYRTVVRNAPDLLPDVLTDVGSLLGERPELPELHRLHGDALIRTGNYMAALESYNRATALTQALDGQ